MKYEDLLEKDEWEVKRYEILARDNYTCQDCGCRGINNDIFFPISKISDLNKLLPDILLNGDNLESFCNGIEANNQFHYNGHIQVRRNKSVACLMYIMESLFVDVFFKCHGEGVCEY